MSRLPAGGRIDRTQILNFRFNGKAYTGYAGDTLASALLANGVVLVGRSFKFHRPRGVATAGLEEFNALVRLDSGPRHLANCRATTVELYEGLSAHSQNVWPSLSLDLGSLLGLLHRLLPAGFYYKTFIAPRWALWEPLIRRLAGLGRVADQPDPDHYTQQTCHCDCLVVGAGPAGLEAALSAAESGQRVLLMDEQHEVGGGLLSCRQPASRRQLAQLQQRLQACPQLRVRLRCRVFGYYDHNLLAAVEQVHTGPPAAEQPAPCRQRLWRIRAARVVLATGALERPLTFVQNDRPGILLAGALSQYLNRYGVLPGRQIVVFTNNDSAYQTALDIAAEGRPVCVVDLRTEPRGPLVEQARARGIPLYPGHRVLGVYGRRGLQAVQIEALPGEQGQTRTLPCDLLAMSGGWNPTIHLYSQAGGSLRYCPQRCCLLPDGASQALHCVGAANGDDLPGAGAGDGPIDSGDWYQRDQPAEQQWVDFQYDITVADIAQAVRENFVSVEHLKRYTGTGMCLDQGKTGNVNALGIVADLSQRDIAAVGTTKFRPPYHPVSIGAMAGQQHGAFYAPARQMPAHDWHRRHGAEFEELGGWLRPACYPQAGETPAQAVAREVRAARQQVGLFEGSPLGKIEVRGPDAATFLQRVYLNTMNTLRPGKIRYGLMLNDNGVLIDDGVLSCLAPEHYQISTTSGGATRIWQWLQSWHQCEWPSLDLCLSNLTQQWAVCTLSGPKARDVLARLPGDIDLSPEALPPMALATGHLAGLPVRLFRVSFTGELSYEINVPADSGQALWQTLIDAGQGQGITPYGLDALDILRIEKGYLHLGADTDGETCPDDVGWGGPLAKKTDDFIGRRSLQRPANRADDRLQLVGLASTEPLPVGAHLLDAAPLQRPTPSQGYVTSACHSPTLNRPVALGLLRAGRRRHGEQICAWDQGRSYAVTVQAPVFYDPKGERLHA